MYPAVRSLLTNASYSKVPGSSARTAFVKSCMTLRNASTWLGWSASSTIKNGVSVISYSSRLVRRSFNGAHDARVGAAAADVCVHVRNDLLASRFGVMGQEVGGAHDLAGLTVAALRYRLGQPRFLHGMRRVGR